MASTTITSDAELQWLMEQSGLTQADLAQYQAILGDAKFKQTLIKLQASQTQAASDKASAEQERLNLEKKLNDEIYPEVRKVTQDSVRAQGELARAKAELEAARQYGIVPTTVETTTTETRAPGSPTATDTTNFVSRDDFGKLRDDAGNAVALMNDINAEHFRLFNSPVPNMTELVQEVQRERTLGHSADLRSVWERKHNVVAKREEIKAADLQKVKDEYANEKLREYKEKHGDNPGTRVARESRFSTYDPNKGSGDNKKPWQAEHMKRSANTPWRDSAKSKFEKALVH